MTKIQDGELSALLDGELDSGRAEIVRSAINGDPMLRDEFDALTRLDVRLRGAAQDASFMPDVVFPAAAAHEAPAWYWRAGAVVVPAVIAARFLPKLAEPLFGLSLQIAVCAAISFIVVRMVREADTPFAGALA
jgi:anti-sigma factor RsiW